MRQDIGPAGSTRVDAHCPSIQFLPADGEPWWLTCVYGPQGNDEKINFLQELRSICTHCQGPWVVAGDFNTLVVNSLGVVVVIHLLLAS